MQTEKTATNRICGEVVHIRFENADSGFAVITLNTDDGKQHAVCGNLAGLTVGSLIEADGHFEKDEKFGPQFRAETFRPILPATAEGIERYLAAGISGIGKKTAQLIVSHFGKDTVKVLNNTPARLREIRGIGKMKADMVISAWKESTARRDSMIFLQGLGISPAYCAKLFRKYDDRAANVVKNNPYRLAHDIDGIGFVKADAIAKSMGFAPDSLERLSAAAAYVLNTATASGHCGLPEEELCRRTCELTGQYPQEVRNGIAHAVIRNFAVVKDNFYYPPKLALAEENLPALLKKIAGAAGHPGTKLTTPAGNFQWAESQKRAVDEVSRSPLSIITGGPGVGKTTVIREIVNRAKQAKLSIALTSPTGRAAKRMSQAADHEAKTIHRLLMYDPSINGFGLNENNPLECDILIADEVSMLDISIAYALFSAIQPGTTVVLVGDADQLPPVGPGRFFSDLINSGKVPVTRLDRVFRQESGSRIIEAAHRVNSGMVPLRYDGENCDFYWIRQDDPEKALDMMQKLVLERIPEKFGFNPINDIQVLTPMNRGSCGTININEILSGKLNPQQNLSTIECGEKKLAPGDKVMQTKNNYDKGVYNGDFGTVTAIDREKGKFYVLFDNEKVVEYFRDEMDEISKAYAITVHKSQGSEFSAAVILLLNQHYLMLQRNLLYTAMTRAKKLLVLIGGEKTIEMAVRNIRTEVRYTRFPELLSMI